MRQILAMAIMAVAGWSARAEAFQDPETIRDLSVTMSGDVAILTWTAPHEFGNDVPVPIPLPLVGIGDADDGTVSGSGGAVASYDIGYSTFAPGSDLKAWFIIDTTTCVPGPTPLTPGLGQTFQLSGLDSETTYFIAIRSTNSKPLSAFSNVVQGTTSADTILPGAVYDFRTGEVASTSVELTWKAPGDDGMNGTATSYLICYSTLGPITGTSWVGATPVPNSLQPQAPTTVETFRVPDLDPAVLYYFSVRAVDNASNTGPVPQNSPMATTLPAGGGFGGGSDGLQTGACGADGGSTAWMGAVALAAALLSTIRPRP